jgi:hypothetical protein
MVIRPMDLATGGKYMYRRAEKLAAGYGFSGLVADWLGSLVGDHIQDYDFEDNWPRPSGSGATSCQQPSFSRTNINSST